MGGRLGAESLLIARASVLAMAAGTFLFMATLNELESTPMVKRCRHLLGFLAMLAGLVLTVCARMLIGEAHTLS